MTAVYSFLHCSLYTTGMSHLKIDYLSIANFRTKISVIYRGSFWRYLKNI